MDKVENTEYKEVTTPFRDLEVLEAYHKGSYVKFKRTQNGDYFNLCERCGGTGKATQYMYHDNGFCYKCMGTGKGKQFKYKPMTDDEIIEDLFNRYKKKCKKKNQLVAPDFVLEKWFEMSKPDLIKHFLNILK